MKRRDFIKQSGTVLSLSAISTQFKGLSAKTVEFSSSLRAMHKLAEETDRIFVIVQLTGGNDGLNTVIPIENPAYYKARPTLGIQKDQAIVLNDTNGLHPQMNGFGDLYKEGKLAIVQGVTYPNPDRSHFRGTDIWLTSTDADVFGSTGWVGRYLDTLAPDFPATLPDFPLAVEVGTSLSLGLQGAKGALGITLRDPDTFFKLVTGGTGSGAPPDNSPDTPAGRELDFIRTIDKSAQLYAKVVQEAGSKGTNSVTYPSTELGAKFQVVSRLISGGLKTRFYLLGIQQGSFDTHASQGAVNGAHGNLLNQVSDAVSAFLDDLKATGHDQRVAGMTFSEFGRRVAENGSQGTDHGTAAPLFVFGAGVNGGKIYGNDPNLSDLDSRGDLKMQHDFREVYSSALIEWFGLPSDKTAAVINGTFTPIGLFQAPNSIAANDLQSIGYALKAKLNADGTLNVEYHVPEHSQCSVNLFDIRGMQVASLVSSDHRGGSYSILHDLKTISAGMYIVDLQSRGRHLSKTISISR